MTGKARKHLLLAVKFVVAAALLGWVFRQVSWQGLSATMKQANIPLLLCALGGFLVALGIVGVRWWFLLRMQDISIGLWEAVRLTFLGQFFNAVVPGVVGGDLFKAYYAAKHTLHKGAALMTVFVDRLIGLAELALLACAMMAGVLSAGLAEFDDMVRPAVAAGVALAAVVALMVLLFSPRLQRALHLHKIFRRLAMGHHAESAALAARRFSRGIGGLIKALAITLAAHALWIFSICLAGRSLSLNIAWYEYFVFVPLIYIVGSVPVTPGGVGLIEAMYKLFFVGAAVGGDQVVALALVVRLLDIVRGLPGALVVITGPKLPRRDDLQAELDLHTDDAQPQRPGRSPAAAPDEHGRGGGRP